MDQIGAQNLVVSTANGTNVLLRDYRTKVFDKKGERTTVSEAAGVSLLGPLKFEFKGRSYNSLLKDKLRIRLKGYLNKLSEKDKRRGNDDLKNSPRGMFIKGILDTPESSAHIVPVTTGTLKDLFIGSMDKSGKLSLVSNGFGLRRPLRKDINAKFDRKVLTTPDIRNVDASYFTSTFEKVIPTRISITSSKEATEEPLTNPAQTKQADSPIITLKKEIEQNRTITASDETKEDFTRLMNAQSFNEAVEVYKERMSEKATYTFGTNTIHGAVREFFQKAKGKSLKESILSELQTSFNTIGVGRQEGKTAARDYIRTTILARMFPGIPYKMSKVLVDLAREHYDLSKEKDIRAFDNKMDSLATQGRTTLEEVNNKLLEIQAVYEEILQDLGIEHEFDNTSFLSAVQSVVMASSKYREHIRSQQTPPIKAEGFEKFLRDLITAANEDADAYEDIYNDPRNKEFLDKLGADVTPENAFDKAAEALAGIEGERSFVYTEDQDIGELMSDQEVSNLLDKLYPPKYSRFIDWLFGSKNPSDAKRFAVFNTLQNSKGQKVWGLYKDGVMSFVRHSSGKIGRKVVLHEYFHKVFWEFLTHGERVHLFALAQERWGNLSEEALEEKMADDFMDFVPSPKPSIFARFWDLLRRLLGFSRSYMSSIEQFYDGIYQRKYSPTGEIPEVERSLFNILTKYKSLDDYFLSKSIIMNVFTGIMSERKIDGKVLSLEEATNETFERLKTIRNSPEKYVDNEFAAEDVKRALEATLMPKTELSWRQDLFSQVATKAAAEAAFLESKKLKLEKLEHLKEEIEQLSRANKEDSSVKERMEEIMEELEATSEDDLLTLIDKEATGIRDETFQSELRDPKIKLTGSVKQKLLSIKYMKNGRLTFGELDRTYAVILSKLSSIPTTSLEDTVDIIYNNFYGYRGASVGTNIKSATGKFMFETAARLKKQMAPDSTVPKGISFRKDVTRKGLYVIISSDGSSTHGVTRKTAEDKPNLYRVIEQEDGTTTDNFVRRVAEESGKYSKTQVAEAYYFFEDLDFIRSLLSAVASMQQGNVHVALQWWDYGKYKTSIYKVKMSGGATAFQGRITTKLDDYAKSISGNQLFSTDLLAAFLNATDGDRKQKLEALQSLFDTLKLPFKKKILQGIPDEVLNRNFSSIMHALEKMNAQFAESIDNFPDIYSWEQNRSATALLTEEQTFLSALGEMLNSHYGLVDNNSYTRGDGKKAYGYRDESYQSSVLTSINRAMNGLSHKVFSTFNVQGGKLKTSDRFLSSNIFFTGKNIIKGVIDYDSKKTKGNSRFAKYLRKEDLADFRERHFSFGFLTRIRQTNGSSYYQFLPIPSNRTSIQAVEVGALKSQEVIYSALMSIIIAQKNRPDPKNHPDLAKNKTYNQEVTVTYVNGDGKTVTKSVPNYKLWKIAGLEGSVDDFTEQQALQRIKDHVKNKVDEMLPSMQYKEFNKKNTVNISDRDLNFAAKEFKIKGPLVSWKVSGKSSDTDKAAALQTKNRLIGELLPFFYYNFIINQYSTSQIVYGDESFYKHKEDQTKRIQIATATGDTLLSDGHYGMPKQTSVLVIKDIKGTVPEEYERANRDVKYDTTDAEGFILPEYYERIALTYGTEALVDVVLKPVYFSVIGGVPTAVKYSAKVLTDELVKEYPHLGELRKQMRDKGADQAVFASAVKVGMPNKIASMSQEGLIDPTSVTDEAILKLDSNLLRFQLNPAKSPETTTRNPSQITAFVNTNGLNQSEIAELHKLNARVIENGRRKISRELKVTDKGTLTNKSRKALRNKIKNSTEGLAGALDLHRLVSYRGRDGKEVSLDLPLIADRAVATLTAMFSDATVGFRFDGSKLVLQADIGKHNIIGESEPRELKWRDDLGYAEVILPETYRQFVEEGELFIPGLKNGLVGFRIPSTNYHSAVPMKVVGFYPVPKGGSAKGNVIIAPSLIVYYHGSDKHHCRNKTSLIVWKAQNRVTSSQAA
jgi:hypothetical protein